MAVFVHHRHRHDETISRPALYAAFGLVALVLGGVTTLVVAGVDPVAQAPADREAVQRETVVLSTVKGGGLEVLDPATGTVRTTVAPGRDGFARTVLRGLDRVRMQHAVPADGPVEITVWANGTATLRDPSTQWSVELASFGEVNLAGIVRIMSDLRDNPEDRP